MNNNPNLSNQQPSTPDDANQADAAANNARSRPGLRALGAAAVLSTAAVIAGVFYHNDQPKQPGADHPVPAREGEAHTGALAGNGDDVSFNGHEMIIGGKVTEVSEFSRPATPAEKRNEGSGE